MWEGFEKQHFDCDCGSDEHTFNFVFDKEEGELYLNVYLNQYHNVFKRIWVAIKYVFGYTSKWGHWDTTILDRASTERLRDLCQNSLAVRAAYVAKGGLTDEQERDIAKELDFPQNGSDFV
jgi:hypothetical protein